MVQYWQNKLLLFGTTVMVLAFSQTSNAFISPYDFGSYSDSPRSILNNSALLYRCQKKISGASRLRYNDFSADAGQNPDEEQNFDPEAVTASGNAVELEFGGCHKHYQWLHLGFFSAISSLKATQSTPSRRQPIIFPFHKTYLPLISLGGAITLIDSVYLGFASQFFQTVSIDTKIEVDREIRVLVEDRVGFEYNWNLGLAVDTDYGIFHFGYQPAYEADLNIFIDAPIDLEALSLPIAVELNLLSISGDLDYRPATIQMGWIGQILNFSIDAGLLVSKWDELGADIFINFSDPLNISQTLFEPSTVQLRQTWDPYFIVSYPITDYVTLIGGYAHFESPIVRSDDQQAAISGEIHSFKAGAQATIKLNKYTLVLRGTAVYGKMSSQLASGLRTIQGDTLGFIGQFSIPF